MDDTSAEVIRDRVKRDHARLRTLLNTALVGACVAQQDPHLVRRVRATLDRVREAVFAHLDFEEHTLLELLRGADAWGRVRADELVSEHATERMMLDAVVEDFDAGDRSFQEMADEIAWTPRSSATWKRRSVDSSATRCSGSVPRYRFSRPTGERHDRKAA